MKKLIVLFLLLIGNLCYAACNYVEVDVNNPQSRTAYYKYAICDYVNNCKKQEYFNYMAKYNFEKEVWSVFPYDVKYEPNWDYMYHLISMFISQEQIVLRDASIAELEKNINALQLQVIETEKTCNLRIKAREDSFYILNKNRLSQHDCFAGVDTAKLSTPAGSIQNKVDYDIVTKDKSNFAINSINNYWNGLLTHTSNNEK